MRYKFSPLIMKIVSTVLCFIFSIFLISCGPFNSSDQKWVNLNSYYYDWISRKALSLKQNEKAHDFILKALEHQEDNGLKSNLGITFDYLDKKNDAEKSLLSALNSAKSEEEKFKFYFNLGILMGAQKKITEALNYYQGALDIYPASTETKHNIELLIQQQKKDQQKEQNDKNKDKNNQDQNDKQNGSEGDQKDQKNKNNQDEKSEDKDPNKKDKDDENKKDNNQDRQTNSKYKPRPFQGDQLSEGDVKKILGELSRQDQKIRSQFNKKEQKKEDRNEKDW